MPQTIIDNSLYQITIKEDYDISLTQSQMGATPYFNAIDDEFIFSIIGLENMSRFSEFIYTSIGSTGTRYLETSYRISRNGVSWTEWLDLEEEIDNFPPFDPRDEMMIDIRFIRKGTKTDGSIRLVSYTLKGLLDRPEYNETIVSGPNSTSISFPPDILKVFKIADIEIISSSNLTGVNLSYRYSQDNERNWTNWEPLTKANITTARINPIRFFQIQYKVENTTNGTIGIQDINLIGDFQNVSKDYHKTNLFGVRDCCQSMFGGVDENGNPIPVSVDENGNPIINTSGFLSGESCSTGNVFASMTDEEKAKLYNPYQQTQASDLLNKLTNDAVELFGHKIQYFITDPDEKGIDYTLHEYQLYNIICEETIKATVDNNQFPDNQIVMNQFDLTLFDSFEIQITKETFKKAFGPHRRPSKEDIIHFCDINRIFIVDHAQQFRNFNNYATYYKVILKKYNVAANIIPGSKGMEDRIRELTKNTTIDELFGIENNQDKSSIANKPETKTLSRDLIRLSYNAEIVRELIENSTTIVSKQHYDLSSPVDGSFSLTQSSPMIVYQNSRQDLKVSDNLGFYCWFKLNNYLENESYNFYHQFDDINSLGWKVELSNDRISVSMNSNSYNFDLNGSTGSSAENLYEDIWYCYVLNIDQRTRNMEQWIYKRDVDLDSEDDAKNLNSTILDLVYQNSQTITPIEYELENIDASIMSSDMRMTNIRLFDSIIPISEHNKILNQYVIADDSKYLIFADNANTRVILPTFPYGTEY